MPGDKPNGFIVLAAMMGAKFGQTKGLSLNLGKQKVYGLNAKPRWLAGALLDFYFNYSGLDGTNIPTLLAFIC